MHGSKSSNLSTLKKFDVLHRDKSQPEVLFRNSNDKNGRGLAANNATGTTTQKPVHHQSNKSNGRGGGNNVSSTVLNNTVVIQGNQTNVSVPGKRAT